MPKVAGDLLSINAMTGVPFPLGPGNEFCEVDVKICSMHWSVVLFDALVRCMSIVCHSSRQGSGGGTSL